MQSRAIWIAAYRGCRQSVMHDTLTGGLCVTRSGTLQAYIAVRVRYVLRTFTTVPVRCRLAQTHLMESKLEKMTCSTDIIVSFRTRRTLQSMSGYGKESSIDLDEVRQL